MGADAIRFDAASLKAALAPTRECATVEELARLCEEDHAGGRDARVAEHVAGCIRCRTELALLKEFERAAPRGDEEEDVGAIAARLDSGEGWRAGRPGAPARAARRAPRVAAGWRLPVRAGAAAVAVAAAALVVVLQLPGRHAPPPLATDVDHGAAVMRSDAVALVAPKGDLETPPTELRWSSVPGAVSYSVEIMEVDRTSLWREEARQPATLLPAAIRDRMVRGKSLLWQVTAKDAAGEVVATSPVQRFRVRGPSARP